jgi:hypothetical protein
VADPATVARKRANAEVRLRAAAVEAGRVFGVDLETSRLPANRYPDLAAAENLEHVAAFIERITHKAESGALRPARNGAKL